MTSDDDVIASLVEHWRAQQGRAFQASLSGSITPTGSLTTEVIRPVGIPSEESFGAPALDADESSDRERYPTIVLQAAVVNLGDATNEGQLIEGVSIAWFEIVKELERNPSFLSEIPWRKLEELVAGAYEREGWPEVTLTPRSRDKGRDVIATKPGYGSIRIVDQIKAYSPPRRVSADEVRSLLGVLTADRNVSKGIVTTSAEFAPGITSDPGLSAFMPHRLELKNGRDLRRWLIEISSRKRS